MSIDWKAVSRSPGYRSLKAAYERDVQQNNRRHGRPMRDKAEFQRKFRWVIGRAKHYASRQDLPLEDVLNEWEAGRDHWWLNYYQEMNQPKLPSGKPRNVKPPTRDHYLKRHWGFTPKERRERRAQERQRAAAFRREHELNKKARWSVERKQREARYRRVRQCL